MSTLGLSVSDVVNVQVNLSPTAAQTRNFGSLLIVGDSPVIDVAERIRLYSSVTAIAADFGTTAPEYLAAAEYFAQTPQPTSVYVGRWASTPTAAIIHGGGLTPAQQTLTNFTSVTSGSLTISVNGTVESITGVSLAAAANLPAVAAIISTALPNADLFWNPTYNRFDVYTTTGSGATASLNFSTTPATGTDLGVLLGINAASGGTIVAGANAETLTACVAILANQSNLWYGIGYASAIAPATSDILGVAAFIQAASPARIFGVTTQDPNTLIAGSTTDLAYQLSQLNYSRTFVQYSSQNANAVFGIFGVAFTVNFTGQNTTITVKFKTEAGVVAEQLTETQAATLATKNCNVYVLYNNSTAIVQQGVMSNGYFFDTIHGTDWLQNAIQTAVFNLLYTSSTKIPQTDAGVNQILTTVSQQLEQSVLNGLVAPGVWTGPNLGNIVTGQTLTKGYYVYAAPISTQSVADRASRKAPLVQAAIKLAGAIHSAAVIVSVNN